jgi:hypothetical protein
MHTVSVPLRLNPSNLEEPMSLEDKLGAFAQLGSVGRPFG